MSGRELEKLQEEDGSRVRTTAPKAELYEWTNKKTGETHMIPKGIDPGFDYNPGQAPWGNRATGA